MGEIIAWPKASNPPPVTEERGPRHDGRLLLRTSLVEIEGAERLDCADGPLWIVESEPV